MVGAGKVVKNVEEGGIEGGSVESGLYIAAFLAFSSLSYFTVFGRSLTVEGSGFIYKPILSFYLYFSISFYFYFYFCL